MVEWLRLEYLFGKIVYIGIFWWWNCWYFNILMVKLARFEYFCKIGEIGWIHVRHTRESQWGNLTMVGNQWYLGKPPFVILTFFHSIIPITQLSYYYVLKKRGQHNEFCRIQGADLEIIILHFLFVIYRKNLYSLPRDFDWTNCGTDQTLLLHFNICHVFQESSNR